MSLPDEPATIERQLRAIALFTELDPRLMRELVEDAERKPYPAGTSLVRQGDYASAFYVVLEGMVTAYRAEPDGKTEIVGVHGGGDWFGESSALSHQAHFATARVDAPSVLLVLDDVLFQKIYRGGGAFAKLIDERYRQRALEIHLRSAPLLKDVPAAVLKVIARGAELVSFAAGKPVLRDGEDSGALYLIRSGVVKQVLKHPQTGEQRIQAYFCDNSSFGEESLTSERTVRGTYEAMTRVDVVKLARELFDEVSRRDAAAGEALRRRAVELARGADSGAEPMSERALDLMVHRKTVVGGRALVIDLLRCTRCNACVESCASVHDDGVPRISKRGIRAGDSMLTSACYHCKIPECMLSCNFGAIRRDLRGGIDFVLDNCTGCTACEEKCPYGVISMAELAEARSAAAQRGLLPILAKVPVLGGLLDGMIRKDAAVTAERGTMTKAIKCDLCAGLPFEACIYNCPCAAISRITPEDFVREELIGD